MNIKDIWRATFLRRWHRNADLAHTVDTLAGHQGRVALLLIQYWPNIGADVIRYALTHDLQETRIGDVCGQAKREYPELTIALAAVEADIAAEMGLPGCDALYSVDRAKVDFCDKLDAILWMRHHAPHLADTDDWRVAKDRLEAMAIALGVCLP